MLTRERQIEIENVVVELLEDYGITNYPISIQTLARKLGIELLPYSQIEESALRVARLASEDAFSTSSVNYFFTTIAFEDRGSYFYRTRFSGAHEIGHIVLEHKDGNNRIAEEEADYFAGYLLAPHPLILAANNKHHVADRFGVSGSCASFACDQAILRSREGQLWRPHEKWLLDNITWEGGGLAGQA